MPPTDEFENLRKLRDGYDLNSPYKSAERAFASAAHAAFGPEGCVTKELERLRRFETAGEGVTDLELVVHERDALLEEVKRLRNLWTPDLDQRWQALVADHETERRRRQAAEAECEDLQKQLDVEVTVGARLVDANEDLASENKLLRQDLQDARDLIPPDVGTSDSSVYGKLSAARSENKLLLASREQLGAENKALLARVNSLEHTLAGRTAARDGWERIATERANALDARMEHSVTAKLQLEVERLRTECKPEPIHALCPRCGGTHVDRGEWATKLHRSHLCEHCGNVWRPFEHYTVGVEQAPIPVSTLSPCPRCGETVPTTFRDGLLTYKCLKCASDK